MAQNNDDIFAPPSQEELDMFKAPTQEELAAARPSIAKKLVTRGKEDIDALVNAGIESGAGDVLPAAAEGGLDFARGVGSGLTLSSADEILGGIGAGAEALYNKFNPTDSALRAQGFNIEEPGLKELYRKNQKDIQKEFDTSSDRSPILNLIGQIGGGVASGSILGAATGLGAAEGGGKSLLDIMRNEGKLKALAELGLRGGKTYAKALPAIAAESALSSKEGGLFNPEERSKLAEDTIGGALFGLPTVLGLQAVTDVGIPALKAGGQALKGKVRDVIEDTPLLSQMKSSYDYGLEGINPRSSKAQLETTLGKTNLAEVDNSRVQNLMSEIDKMDQTIGKAVGDSLENATAAGIQVNLSADAQKSLAQLQAISQKYPELADNTKANEIFSKIVTNKGNITPNEAHELIDYTDAYINKFKNATNKTPLDESVLSNLIKTRKDFSTTLKNSVPDYAKAAERMASFRNKVPETIIARNRPVEVTDNYYGNMKNQDQKMFDALKSVVQGTMRSGSGAAESRTSYVNMIKGLKQFEQEEAARVGAKTIQKSALERPVSAIEEQIKKYSNDAVTRNAMDAISPQAGPGGIGKQAILGHGAETGRALVLGAANKAGLLERKIASNTLKNPVAKLGRGIYNAPDELVHSLADKLSSTPGLEKYGKNLTDAVNSGNNNRKNQILFTVMQNPAARAVVGTDEDSTSETQP